MPSCIFISQVLVISANTSRNLSEDEVGMLFSIFITSLPHPDPCAFVSGFLCGGAGEPTRDPQQAAAALSVPHGAVCCPDR